MSLIIDKSVPIAQLTVAEGHQLLVFRSCYTRESNYLYAIPLEAFYMEKIACGNKASLSNYILPCSKGEQRVFLVLLICVALEYAYAYIHTLKYMHILTSINTPASTNTHFVLQDVCVCMHVWNVITCRS